MRLGPTLLLLGTCAALAACSQDPLGGRPPSRASRDAATQIGSDATTTSDGGELDAGAADTGAPKDAADLPDAGDPPDSGGPDSGPRDANALDANASDATAPDAGFADATPPDVGFADATARDAAAPDAAPADAGTPPRADHHVHIYVDNFCNMAVSPAQITIPAGQTAYFDWHNHSVDYPVDVWMSYGGGYLDLPTGATWDEPIGHCLGPNPHTEYADISTACSSHRFFITCQ